MPVKITKAYHELKCLSHPFRPASGTIEFSGKTVTNISLCEECLRDTNASTDLFIHEELDSVNTKQCKSFETHVDKTKVGYCKEYKYAIVKKSDCGRWKSCPEGMKKTSNSTTGSADES